MKWHLKRESGMLSFSLCGVAATYLCVALLLAQSGGITTKDQKTKTTMDTALKALGGADKIGDVKSLILKGTERSPGGMVMPNGTISKPSEPREFEILILLPNSFVRIRNGAKIEIIDGVSQGKLTPPRPPSSTQTQTMIDGKIVQTKPMSPEMIERVNKNNAIINNYDTNNILDKWSLLLIGTLMKAGSSTLTLSSGTTENIFILTKNDSMLGENEFDSKTGYPSAIKYKIPEQPTLDGAMRIGGTSNKNENDMRFQERFSVNGIMFPKIITITEWGTTMPRTNEFTIKEVQINPKLSLKDFEFER